jgi:hypothetical protein
MGRRKKDMLGLYKNSKKARSKAMRRSVPLRADLAIGAGLAAAQKAGFSKHLLS